MNTVCVFGLLVNYFPMHVRISLVLLLLLPGAAYAQWPGYYQYHQIKGKVYLADSSYIKVAIKNRSTLQIQKDCPDPNVAYLLKSLMSTRLSRRYLEHLLSTSSKIILEITPKVGILYSKGKYHYMAGLTGPSIAQYRYVNDYGSNLNRWRIFGSKEVFEWNKITLFEGSLQYYHCGGVLDSTNTLIYNNDKGCYIPSFTMDSIKVEPIEHPEMLYENRFEFYYFSAIHECIHTSSKNIELQRFRRGKEENEPYRREKKALRKRARLNRRHPSAYY